MKKAYEKPTALVEDFMLTESIASCTVQNEFTTDQGCATNGNWFEILNESFGYFTDVGGSCTTDPGDDDYYGSCYHTSTGSTVFSS